MSSMVDKTNVPETVALAERRLRDGSILKYQLTVLQQPERARACGQGAKSHADRRPVDPPPVVELKLFQGDADVTFQFNSNFFLYASLENARPIANGRVQPSPATQPVLTGVPVSGMAYLDRPAPAGYFIFPDLSVRHEGKYRLHFALFEECKEEEDRMAMNGQEVTHFRVEVKSKPFTVFSAKKFPGLAESTSLSRIVAEQGCRVRIRRDVRMRRRNDKPSGADEMYEEGGHYVRSQRRETPEVSRPYPAPEMPAHNVPHPQAAAPVPVSQNNDKRPRSDSEVSTASRPDYGRMNPAYAERPAYAPSSVPPPPPPTAPAMAANNNYLSFGAQPVPHAPMVAPSNAQPAQVWNQGYQAHDINYPPSQGQEHRRESGEYSSANYYAQAHYTQPRSQTPVAETPYPSAYSQPPQQYTPSAPYHQAAPQVPAVPQQKPHRVSREDLPPLKLTALEPRLSSLSSPSTSTPNSGYMPTRSSASQAALPSPTSYGSAAGPNQTPAYHYPQQPQPVHQDWAYSSSGPIKASEPAPRHAGQKRSWDRVFSNEQHTRERLTNGSRPTQASYGADAEEEEDEFDFTKMRMSYRRADGVQITRVLPDDCE